MKFTLDTGHGILIHAYQAGEISLKVPTGDPAKPYRSTVYSSSLTLGKSNTVEDWPVTNITELESHHFELVWQTNPDIVLLGTGQRLIFPRMEIQESFGVRGIGFEAMDTAAACRTYNLLVAEGRDVMALLIID